MADEIPDDGDEDYVDGELVGPDIPEEPSLDNDPFAALLSSPPFGDLLEMIRERIAQARGQRYLTQEELGKLIGASQVTISRWQTGRQRPQASQLVEIARVAQEHGLRGITAARLGESLQRDVEAYGAFDPRIIRLNNLLLMESDDFKSRFFEIVMAVYHILRSGRQSDAE